MVRHALAFFLFFLFSYFYWGLPCFSSPYFFALFLLHSHSPPTANLSPPPTHCLLHSSFSPSLIAPLSSLIYFTLSFLVKQISMVDQIPKNTPFLFLRTILANNDNNKTPMPTLTTSQQIALSIPEILKHILSFLTCKNRQDSARLVCKEWHAICKDLLPTSYTWILRINPNTTDRNNSDDERDIRDLVSLSNNIIIQIDSDNRTAAASQQRLVSWKNMMGVLSSITRERTNRGVPPRLRTLHLRETVLANFTAQLPQLPLLTTLSTLRIDSLAK